METLWRGLLEALHLLLSGDPEIWAITWRSLRISGLATLISLILGLPAGTWLALRSRIPGRRLWFSVVHTGMALPPVVVGLVVALFLWRTGPLGRLGWMYTPTAMVIAQVIIATPMVVGLTATALQQQDARLRWQLLGLGASRRQLIALLWREARLPLLAAVIAGFGSVISEVGASLMVGGNLRRSTRVLTTAIVLETRRGEFDRAIALSVILLGLAFAVNYALTWLQQHDEDGEP